MRRTLVHAAVFLLLAGISLASPVRGGDETTCRAPSGATCTGEICCFTENACFSDMEICRELLCMDFPEHPECGPD